MLFNKNSNHQNQTLPTTDLTTSKLNGSSNLSSTSAENPLIWPIFSVLQSSNQSWKVHNLAAKLQDKELMHQLDTDSNKDLFKRNFLLMNALFALQEILLPEYYLQVQAMEIRLFRALPHDLTQIMLHEQNLKDYYLDWQNYDTCPDVIQEMLNSFWSSYHEYIGSSYQEYFGSSYQEYIGGNSERMLPLQALAVFGLQDDADAKQVRKTWRRLALKWHPDRPDGDPLQFIKICEAWQTLREHYR